MSPIADAIVTLFSYLTLFGQILAVALVVILVLHRAIPKNKDVKKISTFISENAITGIFVVAAIATMGSLSFSEIAAFTPCKLCWFQRIAMYPIALTSLVSLLKNDNGIRKYVMPLSIIGFLVAGYHILVQTFPQALECSDEVAKCSAKEFAHFGYITIPVMAFTAFLLIILIGLFNSSKASKK